MSNIKQGNYVKILILDAPTEIDLLCYEIELFIKQGFIVTLNVFNIKDIYKIKSILSTEISYINIDISSQTSIISAITINNGFDVIKFRSHIPIDNSIIKEATNDSVHNVLKVLAQTGAGIDNIDLESAANNGVFITNTPGSNSNAVAEFVLLQMLALSRNFIHYNNLCHSGHWKEKDQSSIFELSKKTLGIIGVGNVAKKLIPKANALGMNIITHRIQYGLDIKKASNFSYSLVNLLKKSDFVSVHVPLVPSTLNLIGENELRQMKKGSYIINVARGGIVNEEALYRELKIEGSNIAGAAIDTHLYEGKDYQSPFCNMKNVILSPHIAGSSCKSTRNASKMIVENICKILQKGYDDQWNEKLH